MILIFFEFVKLRTDRPPVKKKKKNIEPRIARRGLSSSVRDPVVFRYRNHETTRRMNRFTDFRLHYNGNSDGYWSWPRLSARESVSAFHCHWDKRGGDERGKGVDDSWTDKCRAIADTKIVTFCFRAWFFSLDERQTSVTVACTGKSD